MSTAGSVKGWIQARPTRAVLVASIIAILIGAQIGFLIGFKVEHDRNASDVAKLKREVASGTKKTTTSTTAPKKVPILGGRRAGTVTATSADSITIKTKSGATQTIDMSSATVVDRAAAGAAADIKVGRHVFVIPPGSEVLVLRDGSKFGRSIDASSTATFRLAKGAGLPAATVKITPTMVVDTVTPITAADIKVGDSILALGAVGKGGTLKATEVIVLPANSKFAG